MFVETKVKRPRGELILIIDLIVAHLLLIIGKPQRTITKLCLHKTLN